MQLVDRDDPVTVRKFEVTATIAKADVKRQVAYGVVLAPCGPDEPDSQGDWYDELDIELAAQGFLAAVAKGDGWGDLMHDGITRAGVPVESYIAPVDFRLGDEDVRAGSWVMAMHYADPDIWRRIEKGELAAFSVGGIGTRIIEEA